MSVTEHFFHNIKNYLSNMHYLVSKCRAMLTLTKPIPIKSISLTGKFLEGSKLGTQLDKMGQSSKVNSSEVKGNI